MAVPCHQALLPNMATHTTTKKALRWLTNHPRELSQSSSIRVWTWREFPKVWYVDNRGQLIAQGVLIPILRELVGS